MSSVYRPLDRKRLEMSVFVQRDNGVYLNPGGFGHDGEYIICEDCGCETLHDNSTSVTVYVNTGHDVHFVFCNNCRKL